MTIPDFSKLLPDAAVRSVSKVPAYALVLVLVLALIVVGIEVRLVTAIVITVSTLLLAGLAIWAIEFRSSRTVTTTSSEQTERLQQVRDRDSPIRTVFDCLVADDDDVYVVYSSTEVTEFVDQL